MGRILFDVSFTRTQQRPAGIPRTVTKLWAALTRVPGAIDAVPVVFHAGGLRRPRAWEDRRDPSVPPPANTDRRSASPNWWIDQAAPGVSALLPAPLRRLAWAGYHRLLFDRISRQDEPLQPRVGDILLLADASWNYEIWRAAARVRRAGGKVVLMVHDIMPVRHPEFCSPVFAWAFVRWLRRMIRCSDALLCNSRTTESDVLAWAASENLLLPPSGHFRLGNDAVAGVPDAAVRSQLASFMDDVAPCFGSVGTIEPKKNYEFLLHTFERLWDRGVDVRLVIAGRATAQCSPLIDRLQAHPQQGLRLLTLLDATDAEISHIYRRCRALVLSSLFEGFGLPLVEARTQGCAVIANDLPVFREVGDAEVSFYAPGAQSELEHLIVQRARDRTLAPVPRMSPFTWDDSAAQCLQVLGRLLQDAAPKA